MAQVQQLTPAQQQQLQNQQMQQQNAMARQIVLQQSYPVTQEIAARTFNPAQQTAFEVTPANVGIVKGFLIKVNAKVTTGGVAGDLVRTNFACANLLKRIEYYDPSNQRHTNTSGLHLHLVNTAKQGFPFLGAIPWGASSGTTEVTTGTLAAKYGNNYPVFSSPKLTSAPATVDVSMYYYLPLAYSDSDLSGAVLANIPQSQQRLKLEFANKAQFFVSDEEIAAGTRSELGAVYKGPAAKIAGTTLDEISYTVYQCYLDQLPVGPQGFILPLMDLSTLYCLEDTVVSGLTTNVDFTVQYANLYKYLSTFAIFENGTDLDVGASKINYISQRSANFSDIRKVDPLTQTTFSRRKIDCDFPPGVIYMDNREKPIYTLQYGNMSFVVNPKVVNANARLLMGYEYLSMRTELVNSGTIATN